MFLTGYLLIKAFLSSLLFLSWTLDVERWTFGRRPPPSTQAGPPSARRSRNSPMFGRFRRALKPKASHSLEPALSAVEWEADESTTGPASLMLIDPDGNAVLIDQHIACPPKAWRRRIASPPNLKYKTAEKT